MKCRRAIHRMLGCIALGLSCGACLCLATETSRAAAWAPSERAGVLGRWLRSPQQAAEPRGLLPGTRSEDGGLLGGRLRGQRRAPSFLRTNDGYVFVDGRLFHAARRKAPPHASLVGVIEQDGEQLYLRTGTDKVLVDGPAAGTVIMHVGRRVRVAGSFSVREGGQLVIDARQVDLLEGPAADSPEQPSTPQPMPVRMRRTGT